DVGGGQGECESRNGSDEQRGRKSRHAGAGKLACHQNAGAASARIAEGSGVLDEGKIGWPGRGKRCHARDVPVRIAKDASAEKLSQWSRAHRKCWRCPIAFVMPPWVS